MKRFAWLTALAACLVVLAGCSIPTSQPVATATHQATSNGIAYATPTATATQTVDAHQAIGELNGIIVEGNIIKCDPTLISVPVGLTDNIVEGLNGAREWNGTLIESATIFDEYSPSTAAGSSITVSHAPLSIKSGIFHFAHGTDPTSGKTYPLPGTKDSAFNIPNEWQGSGTLRLLERNFSAPWVSPHQPFYIELCVGPRGLAN